MLFLTLMDESTAVRSTIGWAIACLHVDRTTPYPLCPALAMHTLLYQLLPTILSDESCQSVVAAVTWICDLWLSLLEELDSKLNLERKLRSMIVLYEPDELNPLLDHQLVFALLALTLDYYLSSSRTVVSVPAIHRLLSFASPTDAQSPSAKPSSLAAIATDARSSSLFYLAFSERLLQTFSQKWLTTHTISAPVNPV
ncbi:unnamed protein product [Dibothriocephalus latus]|uniref:Uncharacterized protein n=1 Tax=Dibothriocephalus latus TaxID=60516 RepID=A0A3P7M2H8_DIBLA|nr:unnamed protein product [Dibothriocephalus latus]